MAESKKDNILRLVEENLELLNKKKFNVYFFVLDTKDNPVGSMEYVYDTALQLHNLGYKVSMLYQEKDFQGPFGWLGEKYEVLPHYDIEKDNVEISPSDFLFIPEIFSEVLIQTKTYNCKRVMILQNYEYFVRFMPLGVTLSDLRISDVITTTNELKKKINSLFPEIRVHVVSPAVKSFFKKDESPQKLIVNVVSRDQSDINKITKPFYWKNPIYKWVTFRDLRGIYQEEFAKGLAEGAITIWIDEISDFGYSCLEAIKSGNIVLAKTTDRPADWMIKDDGSLTDACIWFDDFEDVPDMLASIIRSWTLDKIPQELYDEPYNMIEPLYKEEKQKEDIEKVYIEDLFERRKKEFEEVITDLKNNAIKIKDSQ